MVRMTVRMNDELRQALAQSGGEPLRVVDPQSNATYVVVPSDEYDRLRADLDSVRSAYPLQEAVARAEGWDDPMLDEYADYDARHPRSE